VKDFARHPFRDVPEALARRRTDARFSDDNHRNGLGHGVAVGAMLDSKLLARLRQ
jgi:hypothetical protein